MRKFSIKKFSLWLLAALIIVTALSITVTALKYHYPTDFIVENLDALFDSNLETNIPTLFSFMLIATSGIIMSVIALNEKTKKRIYWYILSVLFFFAAIDEVAQIHEKTDLIMKHYNVSQYSNLFNDGWVSIWLVLIIIIFIIFFRFICLLDSKTRNLILLAGALYAIGALGLEVVGGYLYCENNKIYYMIETTLEEFLEMGSMIVFIYAFLNYLKNLKSNISFKLIK